MEGRGGSLSKQKNKYLPPAIGVGRSLTEGLEDGVGLEDLLLHPRGDVGGDGAEVLHDVLGRLRLAGAGLARDDEALVGALRLQALVRRLGQGEHVRRQGAKLLPVVREHAFLKSGGCVGYLDNPMRCSGVQCLPCLICYVSTIAEC